MEQKKQLFSNDDLKRLIVPLILEQALTIMVGMADIMMVSNAGEAAISGVSLIDMVNNLVISILAALATGGAVVTSQLIGARRKEEACRSTTQLILSSLLITVIVSVIVIALNGPIIRLFFGSIEQDVFQNARIYFILSALSYPFLSIYNSEAAMFRAMNNSGVTFKSSVVMNIINVIGNAIGIYVLHAGVAGVAVPSLISRAVAAMILYTLLKDPELEIHIPKEKIHLDHALIRRMFYIGIPSGIENGIFQLGRVIVVSIISGFGTVQIAANGVANSLDSVGCISGQAMNLAFITVIGRCVGAGDEGQVRYYTKKMMAIAYVLQLACCMLTLTTINAVLKLYGLSQETMELSRTLVRLHNGFAILLWPVSFTFPNMLRACNDVRFTMGISVFSMWTFRIGLSLILAVHFGYGAIGVWIAMIVDWVFRSICFLIRYAHGKWRRLAGLAREPVKIEA